MSLPLSSNNMPEPWAEISRQLDANSRGPTSQNDVGEKLLESIRQPLPETLLRGASERTREHSTEADSAITNGATQSLTETVQTLRDTAQRLHDAKAPEFKSDKNFRRFNENMELLQKRARAAGLPDSEVASTLTQVLRLLEPKQSNTALGEKERMILAQQVLQQAATPSESVGLGKHYTCSAQAVEERIYIHLPSKAAKLVADIALNNQFTTADGTIITIDAESLKPDEESKVNPPLSDQRSYASHVFALTALNVHWNRVTEDPTGKPTEKGAFRFAQMPKNRGDRYKEGQGFFDRGERLLDMRTTPPSIIYDGPLIDVSSLPDVYNQITGTNDSGFAVENKARCAEPSVCVDSTESLQSVLMSAKNRGAFPLLLRVHTGNDGFIDADTTGVWHVVNILDFNPEKKEAFISDQAGKRWDKFMKVDRLYRGTLDPPVRFRPNLPPFQNPNQSRK